MFNFHFRPPTSEILASYLLLLASPFQSHTFLKLYIIFLKAAFGNSAKSPIFADSIEKTSLIIR